MPGAPVALGLASDRGVGYWTLRRRTVAAVMEESSGAHDARARHTTDTVPGPAGSPGFSGIPTGVGMVLDRRGTTHRSEWVARIVTTGFAGRPGRLSRERGDEGTGRKKRSALPPV